MNVLGHFLHNTPVVNNNGQGDFKVFNKNVYIHYTQQQC